MIILASRSSGWATVGYFGNVEFKWLNFDRIPRLNSVGPYNKNLFI